MPQPNSITVTVIAHDAGPSVRIEATCEQMPEGHIARMIALGIAAMVHMARTSDEQIANCGNEPGEFSARVQAMVAQYLEEGMPTPEGGMMLQAVDPPHSPRS